MSNKNQISYWYFCFQMDSYLVGSTRVVLLRSGALLTSLYNHWHSPLPALPVLFRRKRGQPLLRDFWPLTPGIKSRLVNLAFPGVPSDPNLHSSPDLCPPSYETSQIILFVTGRAFPLVHLGSALPSTWGVISSPLLLSRPSPNSQAWLKFCLLFGALKSHFAFPSHYSFGPQHLLLIIISIFSCVYVLSSELQTNHLKDKLCLFLFLIPIAINIVSGKGLLKIDR